MAVNRYKQIIGWLAAIIGIAAESLAIWLIDQLPLWAQVLVYAPGVIAFVIGCILLAREIQRKRRRKRLEAE